MSSNPLGACACGQGQLTSKLCSKHCFVHCNLVLASPLTLRQASGSISLKHAPSTTTGDRSLCGLQFPVAFGCFCQGGFFSYQGTTNVPLKFMIDLQPTSRCGLGTKLWAAPCTARHPRCPEADNLVVLAGTFLRGL